MDVGWWLLAFVGLIVAGILIEWVTRHDET